MWFKVYISFVRQQFSHNMIISILIQSYIFILTHFRFLFINSSLVMWLVAFLNPIIDNLHLSFVFPIFALYSTEITKITQILNYTFSTLVLKWLLSCSRCLLKSLFNKLTIKIITSVKLEPFKLCPWGEK